MTVRKFFIKITFHLNWRKNVFYISWITDFFGVGERNIIIKETTLVPQITFFLWRLQWGGVKKLKLQETSHGWSFGKFEHPISVEDFSTEKSQNVLNVWLVPKNNFTSILDETRVDCSVIRAIKTNNNDIICENISSLFNG